MALRMVPQIGNEARRCKFFCELLFCRLWPLAIDKLKEIKSNSDSIDTNQIGYVFNVIDVTICSIRRKIDAAGRPSLIQTRRGMGYVLDDVARLAEPTAQGQP